jgi:hypothetical protein
MAVVQIIDVRTSDIEAVKKSGEEWQAATEGKRTVRREIVGRDVLVAEQGQGDEREGRQ